MKPTNNSQQIELQLKGKDFLTLGDLTTEEIYHLLNEAIRLKTMQKEGIVIPYLNGKVLGMIFEKSSTRTRVSFEVGMLQLGGHAIFLNANDLQLGRQETIEDTAKTLSRYVNGLMVRTYAHKTIETFAHAATIPVINGLTDAHHPVQVLADLLTILEKKGKLAGLKLCFIGDGHNNMCHSLMEGAVKVGMDMYVASPPGYEPDMSIRTHVQEQGQETGSQVVFSHDPQAMIQESDVVVTDVWASMGKEEERGERLAVFAPYQVNQALCAHAKADFIFLHCLPAHREEEVTADIIEGPHSVVFDEAENRLHAQKAILKVLMS